MPKVKDGYLEARREKILDAATVCFSRKGFMRTTIPDICSEAHVSIGALYRYFPTKMDIIEASVRRHQEDRARRLATAEEKETPQQSLEALFQLQVTRLLSPKVDNNTVVRLHAFGEALDNPQVKNIVQHDLQEIQDHLEKMVLKAQLSGEINSAYEPHVVAMFLNAISDGLILQRLFVPDSSIYLEQVLEFTKALFILGKPCVSHGNSGEEKSDGKSRKEPDS